MSSPITSPSKPSGTQSSTATQRATVAPPDDYVHLTAEGLLLFCQSRLRELDDAIAAKMKGQEDLVAMQSMVGKIESSLKAGGTAGFNDQQKVDEVSTMIDAAIVEAGKCGDNTLVANLQSVQHKLHDGKNAEVSPDELKDMSSMLDNALSSCRSSAEVSMIELQSLVSKRATQLQLTTGMMNSIDEAPKAIAANIGR